MVKIQTQGTDFKDSPLYRDSHPKSAWQYWMLKRDDGTAASKKHFLAKYGHTTSYSAASTRTRLDTLCHRVERGLMFYDKLTTLELRKFVRDRQLATVATSKPALIDCLELADDNTVFHLLNLPPELRVRIYDYHTESLDTNTGHFLALPPITRVSKLVRKESIPVFYQNCSFHFDFGLINPRIWDCPDEATRFFEDKSRLRAIKNITISGFRLASNTGLEQTQFERFALRFKIQIAVDGTMSGLPQAEAVMRHKRFNADEKPIQQLTGREQGVVNDAQEVLQAFHRRLAARREKARLNLEIARRREKARLGLEGVSDEEAGSEQGAEADEDADADEDVDSDDEIPVSRALRRRLARRDARSELEIELDDLNDGIGSTLSDSADEADSGDEDDSDDEHKDDSIEDSDAENSVDAEEDAEAEEEAEVENKYWDEIEQDTGFVTAPDAGLRLRTGDFDAFLELFGYE